MTNPQVSVVVPCYNHAPYLRQRMESILNQTFQDFELILLDDCSKDNSREILQEYANNPHVSQVVFNEKNSGSGYRQWVKGINIACGEWVWIAESDDWAEPTFLETMLAATKNRANIGIVFSYPTFHYPDGHTWTHTLDGNIYSFDGKTFAQQRLLHTNTIYNVSANLLNRKALMNIDLPKVAEMHLCGDWLMYAEMCMKHDVVEVQQVVSHYRTYEQNTSRTGERMAEPISEGIEVLDFILSNISIKKKNYNKAWGKQWTKYSNRLGYSCSLNRSLRKQLFPRHADIVLWFVVYNSWFKIKKLWQK